MPGFPFSSSSKFLTGLFATPICAGTSNSSPQLYTSNVNGSAGLFPKASTGNTTAYGDASGTSSSTWSPPAGYAVGAATNPVDLYIGLIQGTNTTLNDGNFADGTGLIGVSNQISNAGVAEANYSGYKRVRIASNPQAATAGTAFNTISGTEGTGTGLKVSSISIQSQLQFPACVTNTGGANPTVQTNNTIVGFFISSNPKTQAQDVPTSIDIIAYGALSSTRSITANDTPVFTGGAITITLD